MQIYLASPLGFSPEYISYLERIKRQLRQLGHTVWCPWEQNQFIRAIADIEHLEGYQERIDAYRPIAYEIGATNEIGIRESDALLAVLDGAEVDSGTASEVGFASALGKFVYGLRTDRRDCGDLPGIPINLQVLYFIDRSGGQLFRRIEEIQF